MLQTLGGSQKEILQELRTTPQGLGINDIVSRVGITKTAVRQHMATLMSYGYVTLGTSPSTGGRPGGRYFLSPKGQELFPRQYSWFSELMLESIKKDKGSNELSQWLEELGAVVGRNLKPQFEGLPPETKVEKLVSVMNSLDYEANLSTDGKSLPKLEAQNCVYHNLAKKFPEVCRFDISLIATITDLKVDHETCMVKGANKCRFKMIKSS